MLTAQELKWLSTRDTRRCSNCAFHSPAYIGSTRIRLGCSTVSGEACPFYLKDNTRSAYTLDFEDAFNFEARVAAKLALIPPKSSGPCDFGEARMCIVACDSPFLSCAEARLAWARLETEKELES